MTSHDRSFELEFVVGRKAIKDLFQASPSDSLSGALLPTIRQLVEKGTTAVNVNIQGQKYSVHVDFLSIDNLQLLESFVGMGQPPSSKDVTYNVIFPVGPGTLAVLGSIRWEIGRYTVDLLTENDRYRFIGKTHDHELVEGMRMVGETDQATSSEQLEAFRESLEESFSMSEVDIKLNGVRINQAEDSIKWDIDDERYRVKWDADGPLRIYSEGVFVKEIPRERFGLGGTILMRDGLLLNPEGTEIAIVTPDLRSLEQRIGIEIVEDRFGGPITTDGWEPAEKYRESRAYAWLRILGETLNPEEITKNLGREPDQRQKLGELLETTKSGHVNTARVGAWKIFSPQADPEKLEETINEMLESMSDDPEIWKEISQIAEVELFVDILMGDPNDGFILSDNLIKALATRGVSLIVDILDNSAWEDNSDEDERGT